MLFADFGAPASLDTHTHSLYGWLMKLVFGHTVLTDMQEGWRMKLCWLLLKLSCARSAMGCWRFARAVALPTPPLHLATKNQQLL